MRRVFGNLHNALRVSPTRQTGLRPTRYSHTRCFSLDVRPAAGSLGAEIHGVDLRSLDHSTVASIRAVLLERGVIFFREQDLDPAAFLAFTAHFGHPVEYPFVRGIDGFPEIIRVLKREDEKVNFGGVWHSDTSYLEEPPMGSVLLAQGVPPFGGDTMFANQFAAYEGLSEGLKGVLEGLRGVNTSKKADASKTREDRIKDGGEVVKEDHVGIHPVVRRHPETGRKSLYVNVAHTERFEGWTEEESRALLGYLFQHQVKPEFTCRFVWKKGSVAFWDNRSTLHNPINDYHGFRREMLRVTLKGDRPV